MFELTAPYSPAGDQPQAIEKLVASVRAALYRNSKGLEISA